MQLATRQTPAREELLLRVEATGYQRLLDRLQRRDGLTASQAQTAARRAYPEGHRAWMARQAGTLAALTRERVRLGKLAPAVERIEARVAALVASGSTLYQAHAAAHREAPRDYRQYLAVQEARAALAKLYGVDGGGDSADGEGGGPRPAA